ncbi:MAG: DEAD/DEAH box helicase [Actinomyces urogenitalis]|uniref:RNA helicase n=4 Tax=Actinomyces TaxID=1654 RepID=A0A2I1KTA0_9ACTO|nr:DEAD/DEAH box helicase [Actinomyces urogenitalis]KGE99715.1 DNA helicase [Actinomyces urogenitalis S6-C4]MBS5976639.1 DEAD/DEAH box helicase [Actinomyces urogenitalis]MBS6071108.1 DEAD/DEAH box helicase [Actinomyces urogenitalis]MDK8237783.1 DEAD/DEAH box helicase [Actinomyces urogenitalis]MDK8835790.1 DEAD/DEAH box helicase [Actinomyces urogenitalis]
MTDDITAQDASEPGAQPTTDAAPAQPSSGVIETSQAHAPVLDEATPDITDEGDETDLSAKTFADYGVEPEISQALADKGILHPFPIQALTLPVALEGRDVIGQAKTGTGKTLGFGIPLLMDTLGPGEEGWDEDPASGSPQALVVLPTRELAKQVATELSQAAAKRTVRIVQVYGGRAYEPQIEALEKGAEVVVGTPGRLIDLMERGVLSLDHVTTVVLDEADEMLDLGFLPDVEKILARTRPDRQTMLFSATMPGAVVALARRYMSKPTHIRAQDPGDESMTVTSVKQVVYRTHALNKVEVVSRILQAHERGRTIIFTRTKRTAARVAEDLSARGFATASLHGDLGQGAREQALRAFRHGKVDVLVATDVAARGIDVDDVTHVINYQCPEDEKIYVHRIGRTGRAGNSGTAVTFVDWDDVPRWRLIAKALGLEAEEPVETYHTSEHLFADLDIPEGVTGTLPKSQRTLAGLAAEEIEDLGETGKRRRDGEGGRGSRSGGRGGRGARGGSSTSRGGSAERGGSRGRRDGERSRGSEATGSEGSSSAQRKPRTRTRKRTRGGRPAGGSASTD